MRCPICEKRDRRSRVYVVSTMTTLMGYQPYYDENGVFHNDDPNHVLTEYECSNQHKFSVSNSHSPSKV